MISLERLTSVQIWYYTCFWVTWC